MNIAGFVVVGLAILMIWFFVTLVGPIVVQPIATISNMVVDTTFITLYFFIFATFYNTTLLTIIATADRSALKKEGVAADHKFTIIVPARNEQVVIEETVRKIMDVDYPKEDFEVVVVNDGSTDGTKDVLQRLKTDFANLSFLDIPSDQCGRGKSSALNQGFGVMLDSSQFRDCSNWIVGVFDADGVPSRDILRKASYQFRNPRVGALQVTVRMTNRSGGLLQMLQDIEFVTFAKITQFVRNIFKGAVALGGNGQFVRAETLKSVELEPGVYWRPESLTEDLDLGTRILLKGWDNAFVSTATVYQQAVESFGALYKQRTRWGWGSLQTFAAYVLSFKVFKHRIGLVKKIDMGYYLFFTIIPLLILISWILTGLNVLSILSTYNPFPSTFMIANALSFFPLIGYGLWVVRKDYKLRLMIPLVLLTTAYTYHWVPCMLRATIHMLVRDKPKWVKTERIPIQPVVQVKPI